MQQLVQSDKPKTARFSVEASLLEELGERLVASADVALTELIKNAYDADAEKCSITFLKDSIVIRDDGNGMTENEFLNFWMVVGTRGKARNNVSRKYRRKVSGSKGIGRFAARFLGERLCLSTVASTPNAKKAQRIDAVFDWNEVSSKKGLSEIEIEYTVTNVLPGTELGTTLTISLLRPGADLTNTNNVKSETLALTSPLQGLEKPPFLDENTKDPGFVVEFGSGGEDDLEFETLQTAVLKGYVARARIQLDGDKLDIRVYFDRSTVPEYRRKVTVSKYLRDFNIGTPLFIDLRYFPYRKGTFSGLGVNGWAAKDWINKNCGVSIIDNGFRVVPYGTENDDWLKLNFDAARNVRNWRTTFMSRLHPMPAEAAEAVNNPMLYLPSSGQLVGAVFVASSPLAAGANADFNLTPSMDRQGYVRNKAFRYIREITRFGLELIAYLDHKRVREAEAKAAEEAMRTAEADLSSAIKEIARSKSISPGEKSRLTSLLKVAAEGYTEVDKYRKSAQESLELMSLLGVLAGFMTHEFEQTVFRLAEAVSILKKVAKNHPEVRQSLEELEASKHSLESYLDYSRLFTNKVSDRARSDFKVKPQVELVLETLASIREKHGIDVEISVPKDTQGPRIPIAAYSGILLNLLTNAFKALIARNDGARRSVRIIAVTDGKGHRVVVADTGIGIPSRLRARIWEPLFTTTREEANPLGSGMGLGLALVKRVVEHLGGTILLSETTPPGFVTAFQVEFPIRKGA